MQINRGYVNSFSPLNNAQSEGKPHTDSIGYYTAMEKAMGNYSVTDPNGRIFVI